MPPPAFSQNPPRARSRARESLTAALPRRPVTCDEGRSHDRNSFSPRVFRLTDAVRLQWRQTSGYDYRYSRICTISDTDHFGCRLRHSSRQILNCSSNALGVVVTIFPSPDSHRTCLPSLIRASSESVRAKSRYFCASNSCKAMGLCKGTLALGVQRKEDQILTSKGTSNGPVKRSARHLIHQRFYVVRPDASVRTAFARTTHIERIRPKNRGSRQNT
jgi:hypothetical protein